MIRLQDLRMSYGRAASAPPVLALDDWSVAEGERVALVGRSGSGKTTLLNLVAGLLLPDRGTVSVAGHDVAALGEAARDRFRADHVGYVFQTFHLLDGFSAEENVELGAVFTRRRLPAGRAREVLAEVGLADHADKPPSKLSVGQQARVALARALVNRPQVLLADEPTGSLDEETGRSVLELLLGTAREHGITVLCATHDMEVAAAFDRTERVEDLR